MIDHDRTNPSALRRFLDGQSSAGLVLMAAAAAALIIANSPLGPGYEALLHAYVGPLSLAHWINDALMAVFFLLVGLEIKREMLDVFRTPLKGWITAKRACWRIIRCRCLQSSGAACKQSVVLRRSRWLLCKALENRGRSRPAWQNAI